MTVSTHPPPIMPNSHPAKSTFCEIFSSLLELLERNNHDLANGIALIIDRVANHVGLPPLWSTLKHVCNSVCSGDGKSTVGLVWLALSFASSFLIAPLISTSSQVLAEVPASCVAPEAYKEAKIVLQSGIEENFARIDRIVQRLVQFVDKIDDVVADKGSDQDPMARVEGIAALHEVELEISDSVQGAWYVGGMAVSTILAKEHLSSHAKAGRDAQVR